MTFHPHTLAKHTLCWTSLSCLLPAFPIRLWALRGWGLLFILFAVVSSVPRTLPNIYSLWKEKIRQVLILVLPLADMWFRGSFPPCRTFVSSSIYKVGIIVLLLRVLVRIKQECKIALVPCQLNFHLTPWRRGLDLAWPSGPWAFRRQTACSKISVAAVPTTTPQEKLWLELLQCKIQ